MYLPNIESIVHDTLYKIDMHSDDAVALIMGTGAVESQFKYLKQLNDGPARSWWQVEPATGLDNYDNYLQYRLGIREKLSVACLGNSNMTYMDMTYETVEQLLEINIAFAISMARIKYRRVPKPLPDQLDIEGQADYWLKYYNAGGKGSKSKYISSVKSVL
jgi:hypothetical protein